MTCCCQAAGATEAAYVSSDVISVKAVDLSLKQNTHADAELASSDTHPLESSLETAETSKPAIDVRSIPATERSMPATSEQPGVAPVAAPVLGVQNAEVWQWVWGNHQFEDHGSLGLDIVGKRHMIVKSVKKGGLAHVWNEAHKAEKGMHMITKGSAIVQVNDVVDHGHGCIGLMLTALQSSSCLDISMRYVPYFELNAKAATDREIGVTTKVLTGGIREITFVHFAGVIPEHNRACEPGFEVMAGDHIVEVKEIPGSDIKTICLRRVGHEDGAFTKDLDLEEIQK